MHKPYPFRSARGADIALCAVGARGSSPRPPLSPPQKRGSIDFALDSRLPVSRTGPSPDGRGNDGSKVAQTSVFEVCGSCACDPEKAADLKGGGPRYPLRAGSG